MAVMKNTVFCKCNNIELKKNILVSYSSVVDCDRGARLIHHHHPEYFISLLELACAHKDKRANILALWILEKYAVEQPECLDSDFTFFLEGALQQKNDCKRRPLAKLLYHYCKNMTRRKLLSSQ